MALMNKLWSKKHRWKTITVLVVILLGGGGWYWRNGEKSPKETLAEDSRATVEKGDLEVTFEELGDIAAKNLVDVASKVSGRIVELVVEEGQTVKAGQKLAVIQPGKTGAEKFLPSTLTAPIGGLLLRYVKDPDSNQSPKAFPEVGDYVTGLFESQNPTYMMSVADMREIIVRLKINEMDILKLRENMPVTVHVDAVPDEVFPAKVTMISPQAEKEKRGGKVFRVEVTLDKADARLRSGMTARVKAVLDKRVEVLKMPLSALYEEKGLDLVYLDREEEKPKQVFIKTGLRTETDVEILEGLEEDQKVHTEKPVEFEEISKEEFKERRKQMRKEERQKNGGNKAGKRRSGRAMRRAMRRAR
jgi:HlyD family secretion protein